MLFTRIWFTDKAEAAAFGAARLTALQQDAFGRPGEIANFAIGQSLERSPQFFTRHGDLIVHRSSAIRS